MTCITDKDDITAIFETVESVIQILKDERQRRDILLADGEDITKGILKCVGLNAYQKKLRDELLIVFDKYRRN